MGDILPLEALGQRIMICGPSNSGKSTLAVAMARKLGQPAPIHLDLFRHLPNTNWVQRPDEEFAALHDAAIEADAWIIDGNYSSLFPQRLKRATGIVLLGHNRFANVGRYLWRTVAQKKREGALPGNKDSVKWNMIHWILVASPPSLVRYRKQLPQAGLPFVESRSMSELGRLYTAWGLVR